MPSGRFLCCMDRIFDATPTNGRDDNWYRSRIPSMRRREHTRLRESDRSGQSSNIGGNPMPHGKRRLPDWRPPRGNAWVNLLLSSYNPRVRFMVEACGLAMRPGLPGINTINLAPSPQPLEDLLPKRSIPCASRGDD
jgi:hypothetical protein